MKDQIKILLIPLVTFYTPAMYIAILVGFLTIIDTIIGYKKAKFIGEKRTTNRFSDVFAKLIGYAVFLTIGLLVDKAFNFEYGVWVASIIPIGTELVSINESQVVMGKKGWVKQAEEMYKFALKIKNKRDKLR